jgi:aminoglycoside phosphotransferase
MLNAANLRLAINGLPLPAGDTATDIEAVAPVLARQRELRRELPEALCPADRRIQGFVDRYLTAAGVTDIRPAAA